MKKTRKRTKTTQVNNDDLPLSDKEFEAFIDRLLAKPLNPKGIFKNKKTDWLQAKDFKRT